MELSYSVENLRRLEFNENIEQKPITILVGKNSVGKSSFLRSFPLLRQSIETKTSAPILWYGDYVDFGDYESAVANNSIEKDISFNFELKNYEGETDTLFFSKHLSYSRMNRCVKSDNLQISFGVGEDEGKTKRTLITVHGIDPKSNLSMKFSNKLNLFNIVSEIKIHKTEIIKYFSDYEIIFNNAEIFSEPYYMPKRNEEKDETTHRPIFRLEVFVDIIFKIIKPEISKNIEEDPIKDEALRMLEKDSLTAENLKALSENSKDENFVYFYKNLLKENYYTKLDNLCRAHHMLELLEASIKDLSDHFKAVQYIGPARARSERFYRKQELAVSSIDPDGKNLPMFLGTLNDTRLEEFSKWVKDIFGYGVDISKTEGRISINLLQNGKDVNIVDTGYGISQVLPVLAQIWSMQEEEPSHSRQNKIRRTLAIEQPELHLHPAHQALLADVFVNAVSGGSKINFLIETHSEALINRLGELIGDKKISHDDVQIVIFADESEDTSNVQIATFDEKGALENWPYGFFNYS